MKNANTARMHSEIYNTDDMEREAHRILLEKWFRRRYIFASKT